MNRQPSNQYTWSAHFVLATLLCLWLYYARELHVPFSLTVVVAVAITLCGGFVTSIRANGLFRRGERAVAAEQGATREREAEFDRLVFMLPALFLAFATLWPDRTQNAKFTMHEFSNWLRWALCEPRVNVLDWMMGRPDDRGRRQMLRGVTGHIQQPDRVTYEEYIDREVRKIVSEMGMYASETERPVQRRSHRRQDGGRRPRRASRPRAQQRTHQQRVSA